MDIQIENPTSAQTAILDRIPKSKTTKDIVATANKDNEVTLNFIHGFHVTFSHHAKDGWVTLDIQGHRSPHPAREVGGLVKDIVNTINENIDSMPKAKA